MANNPAKRRLLRDFKRLQSDPPEGITATPCDNNIYNWHAVIFGFVISLLNILFLISKLLIMRLSPEDEAWEGGTFQLSLVFTDEYPNKAPKVKFISKMFHPNGIHFLFLQKTYLTDHNINHSQNYCLFVVYADGSICLDILQNQWSPIYDISAILTSIRVSNFFFLCEEVQVHSPLIV